MRAETISRLLTGVLFVSSLARVLPGPAAKPPPVTIRAIVRFVEGMSAFKKSDLEGH